MTNSLNPFGLIPHKRLFGFVGGLVSGRIEKWEHGLAAAGVLGSSARTTGVGGDGLGAVSGNLRSMNSGCLQCFLANWK